MADSLTNRFVRRCQQYEEDIRHLQAALRDCMDYVDADNLTMQTKHRNWQNVLNGGPWNRANVVCD